MSAPAALQPLAANEARAPRVEYYTNKGSAIAAAERFARQQSPTGTYRCVAFVIDCYQAVEGGVSSLVRLEPLDWEMRTVPPAELGRMQQSGLRSAVDSRLEKAK